jgi:23S rRNA pseudouridine1911/1915/1917 synthase
MADHGWPLVGDTVYGRRSPDLARQALHATRLDFTHPVTGARLAFESPVPPDMEALLATLR